MADHPRAAESSSRSKTLYMALAGGLALLLLALWQAGAFVPGKIFPGETPVRARTAETGGTPHVIVAEERPVYEDASGTLRSRDEIEISPRIVARVTAVHVRSGDRVRAGQRLLDLDDTDLRPARDQAAQGVKQAKAALDLAGTERARMDQLYATNAIPKQELDRAISAHRQAQALFHQSEQAWRRAEAMLSYATLTSPIAGVVSERLADPGDMAQPGQTLLRVFDPDRLCLEAPISESLLPHLTLGQKVPFHLHAIPGDRSGTIQEIVPSVDPGSRTFLIKIRLPAASPATDSEPGLMTGMSGVVRLPLGTRTVTLVPSRAIHRVGQVERVVLRSGTGPESAVIQSIPLDGDPSRREVMSGLAPGETVMLAP